MSGNGFDPDFMELDEAANNTGLSETALKDLAYQGYLRTKKTEGKLHYRRADIRAFLTFKDSLEIEVGQTEPRYRPISPEIGRYELVGVSEPMQKVYEMIERLAPTDVTVFVGGESGTGKELVARAIHYESPRRDSPLYEINCAAVHDNLAESEIFGHEAGSFTGASRQKKGYFELATNGSLFLDEITKLSGILHHKLLRVLETQRFLRLGGEQYVTTNARLIAGSSTSLEDAQKGGFTPELRYRLEVAPINVPPLRDRGGDIRLLTQHFCSIYSDKYKKQVELEEGAMKLLREYDWPGNVRELRALMERAIILSDDGNLGGDYISDLLGGDEGVNEEDEPEERRPVIDEHR